MTARLAVALAVLAGAGLLAAAGGASPKPWSPLAAAELAHDLPPAAAARLAHLGVVSALERRTSVGGREAHELVVRRELRFATAAGAETYVALLRAHPAATIGRVESERAVAGGVVLTAASCGCHGETPLVLYAAARGTRVRVVLAQGPRMTPQRVIALARAA